MYTELHLTYEEAVGLSKALVEQITEYKTPSTRDRKNKARQEGWKIIIRGDNIAVWNIYDGKSTLLERKVCPDCDGSGQHKDTICNCSHCGGHGRVMKIDSGRVCPDCEGSGKRTMIDYCDKCKGLGLVLDTDLMTAEELEKRSSI